VHADPDPEAAVTEALLDRLAFARAFVEQREAGPHGALGVVLARALRAERGEQAVAGVLQHLAAVRLDLRGAAGQQTIHHRMDVLRVEAPAQRRRADDIHEQHADLAQ
jgi:hypothetical protein